MINRLMKITVIKYSNANEALKCQTNPPVVAFLKSNAESLVGIGDDPTLITREIHRNPTFHIQRRTVLLHSHTLCHYFGFITFVKYLIMH